MEDNNFLIRIESIKKDREKELRIGMEENLEPHSDCCIYKVPKDLRKINEEAYTPQVISIGPLHHGKPELAEMEKQKVRYQREFSKRISMEKWQQLISFIENQENFIRNCYEDQMAKFEKTKKFVTMIIYDAVFIIEFLLRHRSRDTSDFLLNKPRVKNAVLLDLQLLENQLPYFVIKELYKLAFPFPNRNYSFFELSCTFFQNIYMASGIRHEAEEVQVKHFTDLGRSLLTKTIPKTRSKKLLAGLPCSVKLQQSGLKFKRSSGKCLLDLRFEKKKLRIPWFEAHELQIPRIEVEDGTECMIRNVMALEQCHYPRERHVCNYIDLMDFLINTEADVNLLDEAGIVCNSIGDNARIAKMFNELCLQIDVNETCFSDIIEDLKAHYDNPWNHVKATLKRVYFSNLWRGTGTVAAIVIVLLTLIQTICSILQVLWI